MTSIQKLAALLVTAATVAGCTPPPALDEVPTEFGEETPVDLGTGPARALRRMDIDQLDESIFVATGMHWEVERANQFRRYRSTLGVPNFTTSTQEDFDISPLFLKFVDDAARSVCTRLLDQETAASAMSPVFLVHADTASRLPADQAEIDQNLAMLLARFHGRVIEPGSDELTPWRGLWSSALALTRDAMTGAEDGEVAWRTVCVALIDHPDFYTY